MKNFKQYLKENKTYTTPKGTRVYENPSSTQFSNLLNKHENLRVTIHPNGKDYIAWDAFKETHQAASDVGFERGHDIKFSKYHAPGGRISKDSIIDPKKRNGIGSRCMD